MKKYWFYFGMGVKEGQIVHKNGIVGSDTEFCPIIDIENILSSQGAEALNSLQSRNNFLNHNSLIL